MKPLLLSIILAFASITGLFAQILVSKPYLKFTNTITNTSYKINRPESIKHIETKALKQIDPNNIIELTRGGFVLSDNSTLPYSQIAAITIKPINKLKMPLRIAIYSGYAILLGYAINEMQYCPCEGYGGYLEAIIIGTPFVILGTEGVLLILQALTAKREFYDDQAMKIEFIE